MDFRKVFTVDPYRFPLHLMQELVNYLHTHQQKYIVMVDPAVAYQNYSAFNDGVAANAFMKWANGSVYKGVVWPGVTAFPVSIYVAFKVSTGGLIIFSGLVRSRHCTILVLPVPILLRPHQRHCESLDTHVVISLYYANPLVPGH